MTALQPYQQHLIDLINSGATLHSGRRMGKSFRAKMIREYCEANGIQIVELKDVPRKPVQVWYDEAPDSWVKQRFVADGERILVGFDPVAPD